MDVLTVLESIGIFAFAMSGGYVAIQKNMDLFGIYLLAIITAMGGGITRDVVMSRGVPVFFSSYRSFFIILIAATLVIFLKNYYKWSFVITIMDAIGLAVFTVDTCVKAIASHYNLLAFVFVAVITAVGGGVIRDVLCSRVPVILRKEIYATASLAGALLFWVLYRFVGVLIACYICIAFIIAFRLASVYFRFNLPKIKQKASERNSVS
ncbi:trimeric intracellular cation channel family protein [Hydrogenoanaerobacterium sp.]|uniref:trimeric intracellular cation channel family protein n=1 Tax=Hydrogenoanaerobacterium sp. TaxID=2953763 RepID=UPI0028998CCC|nr:trimeric intracellular cation channel family protein [Hydrogenoanaerobacterium sp.]